MIETERLTLRAWRDEDVAPFHAMSQDDAVMAHLGGPADWDAIHAGVARVRASQAANGFCFWAIERRADADFLGFCGLKIARDPGTPIDGMVEIGWRLRADAWGQGYAREAAEASLAWGWANLDSTRIVAITVQENSASWRLMERLGMIRRADLDFAHPGFPAGHPLSAHIAYVAERPGR